MRAARALAVLSAFWLAACGGPGTRNQADQAAAGAGSPGGGPGTPLVTPLQQTGCLAGVVVDGVSGQRLDLAAANATLFVQVGDRRRSAAPLLAAGGGAAQPSLVGEFTLCDVPVEAVFPFYAAIPGYQAFESPVLIPSSAPAQGKAADADVMTPVPTLAADVRLFQLTAAPKAYTVSVAFLGAPVVGAQVWLAPTGAHVLQQGNSALYLTPDPTGFSAVQATTDVTGVASFDPASLLLGGVYAYQVLPLDSALQQVASGPVTIGLTTRPGEPYALHVALAPVNTQLVVVSSSLSNNDDHPDGSVTYYFNRPIELVPGTVDAVTATLGHVTAAKLVADVPGNNASEQVTLSVSGQTLTLKPNYQTAPAVATEPAATITYNNVQVRPTSGHRLLDIVQLSPTVKLFGGASPPGVPTAVVAASGDAQAGSANTALAKPLVAQVNDQYGQAMAGVTVTFAAATGGGSVQPQTATTNAQGTAQTLWTLGASGAQTATASAVGATAVTFSATFLAPTHIVLIGGNNQTAAASTVLPTPLTVTVTDANNTAVAGAAVTFAVSDLTNGGALTPSPAGGATPAKTVTITADSTGQAAVLWTLGAVAGTAFKVTVTAGTATPFNFAVTNNAPTTLVTPAPGTGNGQTAVHLQALTNPIMATIHDQNGLPLAGVTLQFTTANVGGTLQVGAGTPAQTVTGVSNASGQVSVVWVVGAAGPNTAVVTVPAAPGVVSVTFMATST